jgi:hypothetical protein
MKTALSTPSFSPFTGETPRSGRGGSQFPSPPFGRTLPVKGRDKKKVVTC